jgi:hypothetical protein
MVTLPCRPGTAAGILAHAPVADIAPAVRPSRPPDGAGSALPDGNAAGHRHVATPGDIVGYRAFVAIVVTAYFTIIALTPPLAWETEPVPWPVFGGLSLLYLALGIWGFELARRRRSLVLSLGYLTLEFGVGLWINSLAWGGMLPLILLPLAAQAVSLLPRGWAAVVCVAVIAGVSGNLSWVPAWPEWLRNIASATAAVVFVVVYVGVAERERAARERAEQLAGDVAALPARSTTRSATT